MAEDAQNEVHIGSNCSVKFKLDVNSEDVRSAIKLITSEVNFEEMQELIPVEDFPSVIGNVKNLKIFDNELTRELSVKKGRIQNKPESTSFRKIFLSGLPYIFGALIGVFIGSDDLQSHFPTGLVEGIFWVTSVSLIVVPILAIVVGHLVIDRKWTIPAFKFRYPKKLESKEGNQLFEVSGEAFVQMFVDCSDETDGIERAKYVLDLDSEFSDGTVNLTHFISLTRLKAIYQCDPATGERISSNLLSFLGRKLKHSSFIYTFWAFGNVLWKWLLPLGIVLIIQH